MAANGLWEQFGLCPRRFLHLIAHASLTRRLNEDERAAYGVTEPWGLTPANAFAGITMRYTDDHRILIRQGLSYRPGQRIAAGEQAAVGKHQKALFDQRFPMLKGVGIEHTWSGFVCLSRNGAPAFGQIAPNIWSAAC